MRGYHQLRLLSRRHQLTLLAPAPQDNPEAALTAIRPYCQHIEVICTPTWKRLLPLSKAPFSPLPLQTLYYFDPAFGQTARRSLAEQAFDLVHVQLARMAPVINWLGDVPTVIDLIDALSLNMRRRAQREKGPRAWAAGLEAQRLQRYERALSRQYNELVICSSPDKQAVGGYENIRVVPNAVSMDEFHYREDGRETAMIVFTGRMGYFPNADAAAWFAEDVFPLVRRQIPEAQFFVVGADPTSAVRKLAELPNVTVTGRVPRMQHYLERATVSVAPMRAGSGMQFKVLESMACGAPVVATPYALGGIDATDGEHLLVSTDAEGLAEHVAYILRDKRVRLSLARRARDLVETRYTWERSVAQIEEVYQLALKSRAG